ncbi:hypothetical protein Tco_0084930 [Tanacetum coccineum]
MLLVLMSADVARGHGGDGGGNDRPPSHHIPTGCGGCLGNRGHSKTQFGWQESGQTAYPPEDPEPQANYIGELVRELPLHYPSWRQVPTEQKAGVMARIGTQFDMHPHMKSDRWPLIYAAIQQHLPKIYNDKKAALKESHWIPDSDGTYDPERIRLSRPSHISEMKSSATIEYPSLIYTFFLTHTVNGEDKALYEEMLRLQGLGSNTEMGQGKVIPPLPPCTHSSDVVKLKKREKVLTRQVVVAGVGRGDDEQGDDEDDGEDGEDEDDS